MENESFSEKVMQQLERAVQPAFTNLSVEWLPLVSKSPSEGSAAPTSSSVLSFFTSSVGSNKQRAQNPADLILRAPLTSCPIFNGHRYTAFAIGPKKVFDGQKVVLSGFDASGRAFRLEVTSTGSVTGSLLHTAAARVLIEELTEEQLYSLDHKDMSDEGLNGAIESLSLTYNIVSNRTAFVCIEKRELSAWQRLSVPQRRNVPMMGDRHGGNVPLVSTIANHASGAYNASPYLSGNYDVPDGACFSFSRDLSVNVADDSDDVTDSVRPVNSRLRKESLNEPADKLQQLLKWQEFDGSFYLNDEFCEFTVAKTQKQVEIVTDKLLCSETSVNDAWKALAAHKDQGGQVLIATLIALGYLLTVLQRRKIEWNMIADKAVAFLAKHFKHLPRTQYERLASTLISLLG